MNRYLQQLDEEALRAQAYKAMLGGGAAQWEARGRAQLDFLIAQGLQPATRLLDIGCGPVRAGRHFIAYLDPGCYAGVDFNASFLAAAAEVLGTLGLADRRPALHEVQGFRMPPDLRDCDMGLAFSVLNHCSAEDKAAFFARVARAFRPDAAIFVTHARWFRDEMLADSGLELEGRLLRADCPWFEGIWTETELEAGLFPILRLRVRAPGPA